MTSGAPLRVLYVEDDRVAALLFQQALSGLPWIELRWAEDGAEAIAMAADWLPEVLVLDAHLPDAHGDALLAQLRTLHGLAVVPAFMCSADGDPADLQRAEDAGFAGYWVKPVSQSALRAALQRLHCAPP